MIEDQYEALKSVLREQAEVIRKDGFDVDDDLRISPTQFKDFLGDGTIKHDNNAVAQLEGNVFKPKEEDPNHKVSHKGGEFLEMAKTIMFNRDLFNQRLIALRTCKYDDYVNDVDEVIIDRQTGQAMAAIDTTTDLSSKLRNSKVLSRVANGCRVKYGLTFNPHTKSVGKITYNKLPLFIISLSPDQLADLVKQLVNGFSDDGRKDVEIFLQKSLSSQSNQAASMAGENMKNAYLKAGAIFNSLE
ncbi:MAG: hypothetical protein Q8Q37_01705 [bacterium]|nr:hypothetical protein [bacterium]